MDTPIFEIILGSLVIIGPLVALNILQRKKRREKPYEPPTYSGPADLRMGNPWRIGRSIDE